MSWNPLDDGLLSSTVLEKGPVTVAVWALLLASKDRNGDSKLTPSAAAGLLRISTKEAENAFGNLNGPDPRSRNREAGGRRIVRTPEGFWHVVSHGKYQAIASKAAAVRRQQRFREGHRRTVATPSEDLPHPPADESEVAVAESEGRRWDKTQWSEDRDVRARLLKAEHAKLPIEIAELEAELREWEEHPEETAAREFKRQKIRLRNLKAALKKLQKPKPKKPA